MIITTMIILMMITVIGAFPVPGAFMASGPFHGPAPAAAYCYYYYYYYYYYE